MELFGIFNFHKFLTNLLKKIKLKARFFDGHDTVVICWKICFTEDAVTGLFQYLGALFEGNRGREPRDF